MKNWILRTYFEADVNVLTLGIVAVLFMKLGEANIEVWHHNAGLILLILFVGVIVNNATVNYAKKKLNSD